MPYLDEARIIRVSGRLKHAASMSTFHRHPAVLPVKSIFTQNLIREEYDNLMHEGPQIVLASIRENYWPINGRNITRNVVRKCIICFKQRLIVEQSPLWAIYQSKGLNRVALFSSVELIMLVIF